MTVTRPIYMEVTLAGRPYTKNSSTEFNPTDVLVNDARSQTDRHTGLFSTYEFYCLFRKSGLIMAMVKSTVD